MTTAQIKKNRGISVIWTLPLIALGICAWLVYSSFKSAGVEITISFENASGIVAGKTQVMARGIPVGLVTKVNPDLDHRQIQALVKMDKSVAPQLVDDTLFWIVRPELSASSVQGLDTILSGSYIGIQVGISTTPRREFSGLQSAPPVSLDTPGLHLRIESEALGSIQAGTGVYYRNIQIGEVQRYFLVGDQNVRIEVFIKPEFSHLVREGSRFCNASGIRISGKLPAFKIQVESLAALLRGGIQLYTPEQMADTPVVENGHSFTLYPDFDSASYGIPMTLTLASSEDIVVGSTKVVYRGLEAGFVKEIKINDDDKRIVTAHILLDPRAELILRENTKFWLVKPEISPSGIQNLQLLLSGAHITFQPGDGAFRDHFDILSDPPPQTPLRPGQALVLNSDGPLDISAKSPVYFKNIQVGEVIDVDLDIAGKGIRTSLYIYQKYLGLLSKNSVFWVNSGIQVNASLSQGLALSTGPLAKIVQGGVSFTSLGKLPKAKKDQPGEGYHFHLHRSFQEAVAAVPDLQPAGVRFRILAPDAESLAVGSPILHKKIKIGEVEGFKLSPDQQSVLIDCLVYQDFKNLVHDKSRFYNTSGLEVSGGLDGIKLRTGSLQSVLAGGIGCINPAPGSAGPRDTPYPLHTDLDAARNADDQVVMVLLDQSSGLKVGSPLRHKGLEVGKVIDLSLEENHRTIRAVVRIERNIAPLFRQNTRIWVEQAEFNLSGVKNAETLVFGSYLAFLPGDGPATRNFTALAEPPRSEIASRDGLGIVLEAGHLGSLSVGSPVYYRQVQIGEVTGFELAPTFRMVRIYVNITARHKAVIRAGTRFWQVSGAKIEGGIFSGITVSTESLTAIMRGGIALATPEGEEKGAQAEPGHRFVLHDQAEPRWLDGNGHTAPVDQEPANNFEKKSTR